MTREVKPSRTGDRRDGHSRLALAVAAAAITLIAPAGALQAQSASQCESAALRVDQHRLPAAGSADWNDWGTLTGCGPRGAAVIAGTLQSSNVRAENELGRLDALTGLLDGWFAPSLVDAYESLATAPDVSPGLRLRAMWLLAGLFNPAVDVAGPQQDYVAASCQPYGRSTSLRDIPASLPPDAFDGARSAFAQVSGDESAPPSVRFTAQCWESVLGNAAVASQPRVVVQPVAQQQVPVEVYYDCGNRFIVRNDDDDDVVVHYAVAGAGYGGYLRLDGRHSYSFVAARFGPLGFWLGDRRVAFFDYTPRPCYDDDVYYEPAPFYAYPVIVAPQPYYGPPVVVVRPWFDWRDRRGDWDERRDDGRSRGYYDNYDRSPTPRAQARGNTDGHPRGGPPVWANPRGRDRGSPPPQSNGGQRWAHPSPGAPPHGGESQAPRGNGRGNPQGNDHSNGDGSRKGHDGRRP